MLIIGIVGSIIFMIIVTVLIIIFGKTSYSKLYVKTTKGTYDNIILSKGKYNLMHLTAYKIKKILKVYSYKNNVTIENKDKSKIQYDESSCKIPLESQFKLGPKETLSFPCDGIEINKNPDILITVLS